jgi:hypothetical protein
MSNTLPSDTSESLGSVKKLLTVSTAAKEHPVSSATLDNVAVKNDGKLYFAIDGHEWPAKEVNIEVLRKFAAKNELKRSQPPHHSLSRRSKKVDIIKETMLKMARLQNCQPDPWEIAHSAKAMDKKLAYVNRYRLSHVLFNDGLREDVVNRGKICEKNDLDNRLTSDQLLYQKIATEYNKRGVDEYDRVQCPVTIASKMNQATSRRLIGYRSKNLERLRVKSGAGDCFEKPIGISRFL